MWVLGMSSRLGLEGVAKRLLFILFIFFILEFVV